MKKHQKMVSVVAITCMIANVSLAGAYETKGGKSGKTSVTCSISRQGGSTTYSQAYLKISARNKVEKLGIKNINIVKKTVVERWGKQVGEQCVYRILCW